MRRRHQRIRPTVTDDGFLIGLAEIARYMRCSPRTVQRWLKTQGLAAAVFPLLNRTLATTRGLLEEWGVTRARARIMAQRKAAGLS